MFYMLYVVYLELSPKPPVQVGDSQGNQQVIPPVIARNRLFGANLVGKYFPRLVPFGPFGFYENFYFNT